MKVSIIFVIAGDRPSCKQRTSSLSQARQGKARHGKEAEQDKEAKQGTSRVTLKGVASSCGAGKGVTYVFGTDVKIRAGTRSIRMELHKFVYKYTKKRVWCRRGYFMMIYAKFGLGERHLQYSAPRSLFFLPSNTIL